MKIGLISDIHADFDGLRLALDLLERQGCTTILCAGDLVGKGQHANDVINLIRARGIPAVMGNHDLAAEYMQELVRRRHDSGHPMLLDDEALIWLKTLPFQYHLHSAGVDILMTHGAPGDPFKYLFWDDPADDFRYELTNTEAHVIVVGHTHSPMQIQCGDRLVLNPGSVIGQDGSNGSHTCATLTLPGCKFEVWDIVTGKPAAFDTREIKWEV